MIKNYLKAVKFNHYHAVHRMLSAKLHQLRNQEVTPEELRYQLPVPLITVYQWKKSVLLFWFTIKTPLSGPLSVKVFKLSFLLNY